MLYSLSGFLKSSPTQVRKFCPKYNPNTHLRPSPGTAIWRNLAVSIKWSQVPWILRSQAKVIESVIDCNCLYLSRAYSNNTYNYRFSVIPGIHGEDLLYTFYPTTLTGYDLSINIPDPDAKAWQSYFTSFVMYGTTNTGRSSGTVTWPICGSEMDIIEVSLSGFTQTTDDELPADRCTFWQSAPYM